MAAQRDLAEAFDAPKRHREGDLEILGVVLIDLVKLGIAMRRIVLVDHQPVLRLLVGVQQPRCRDFPRRCQERCRSEYG